MPGDTGAPAGRRDRSWMERHLPLLAWLPDYQRAWLRRDALAGLTVWALLVPEAMAYAAIAGVPVQYGLYAVPLSLLGYVIFGGSRQLFVGPSASVATISAATVGSVIAANAAPSEWVALTAAVALMVGVIYRARSGPDGVCRSILRQAGARRLHHRPGDVHRRWSAAQARRDREAVRGHSARAR